MTDYSHRKATDFLCLAMSDDGYICNEPPSHEGDHVAKADSDAGRREVRRWPS